MKTMMLRALVTMAILAGLAAAPDAQTPGPQRGSRAGVETFRWEPNSRNYDIGARVERALEQAQRSIERQWRSVERLWDQRLRSAERRADQARRVAERRAQAVERQIRARVQRQINDEIRANIRIASRVAPRIIRTERYADSQVGTDADPCRSSNDRDDDYGGSLRNRARFLLEVIRAIRKEVGRDYHLQVKINAVDNNNALFPWEKKGNTLQESIDVCRWVEDEGADALHVSMGSIFPHPQLPSGGLPPDELNWWYGGMVSSGIRGYFNYTLFHFKALRPVFMFMWNRTKKQRPVEAVREQIAFHERLADLRTVVPLIAEQTAEVRLGLRELAALRHCEPLFPFENLAGPPAPVCGEQVVSCEVHAPLPPIGPREQEVRLPTVGFAAKRPVQMDLRRLRIPLSQRRPGTGKIVAHHHRTSQERRRGEHAPAHHERPEPFSGEWLTHSEQHWLSDHAPGVHTPVLLARRSTAALGTCQPRGTPNVFFVRR